MPRALDSYFQCAIFNISDTEIAPDGVTNITLHLASSSFPETTLVFENEGPPSQFSFIQLDNGDLFFSGLGALQCPDDFAESSHTCGSQAGEDIAFGIRPVSPYEDLASLALTARVTAINSNPVPEPATLMLMGTAAAAFAGRRLRRKTR